MKMTSITYDPIGTIYTPFTQVKGMPIQAVAAKGVEGHIELQERFILGLKDLQAFSHLILIYDFHFVSDYSLVVTPFLDRQPHGIFATRYPKRPNKIGISTVRLKRIDGNYLFISDVDMLNGTPLLDIKPYVPDFDCREGAKIGWFEDKIDRIATVKAYEPPPTRQ